MLLSIDLPAPDVVHVWRVPVSSTRIEDVFSVLNTEERNRAVRFMFDRDRNQFIVARGMLRRLIGAYLHCEVSDITFQLGPAGKPALAQSELRFNVSHSNECVLLAFAVGREIGVDVEYVPDVQKRVDIPSFAKTGFSAEEQQLLAECAPECQLELFCQLWTAKEAYIKMLGGGLSIPLQEFSVMVSSESRSWPVMGSIQASHIEATTVRQTDAWRRENMCDVEREGIVCQAIGCTLPKGYIGAVAAEGNYRVDMRYPVLNSQLHY